MSDYGKTALGTFYDGTSGEKFIQAIYEARGYTVKRLPEGMFGHDLYIEEMDRFVEVEHRQSIAFDKDSIARWREDGYILHVPKRRIRPAVSGNKFDFVVLSTDYQCSIIVHPERVDWDTTAVSSIDCSERDDGMMYMLELTGENYGEVWSQFHP